MTTETYYFSGKAKWAKVQKPDEKYDNYQVTLYMDDENFQKFKESKLKLSIKEDENSDRFVVFKRKSKQNFGEGDEDMGPPKVFIGTVEDYQPFTGLIGNGSDVTLRVSVYDTRNGKGHRLEKVLVTNLVEYNPPDREGTDGLIPF